MKAAAHWLALVAMLGACDRQEAPVRSNDVAIANATPDPAPPAEAARCADGWTVTLDGESFAHNGADRTFPAARLELFRGELEKAVRGSVNAACTAGDVEAAKASKIKRLTVFSASGADEPSLTGGDDPATVRLEYVFAENDLTIPSEMELRGGLVCWTDPAGDECAQRGP